MIVYISGADFLKRKKVHSPHFRQICLENFPLGIRITSLLIGEALPNKKKIKCP
jgi:hypothetical protein